MHVSTGYSRTRQYTDNFRIFQLSGYRTFPMRDYYPWRIPIRIVGHVGTYLHLHDLLHDIELPIPTRIDGDHRQRYDVLIRGQLEQCLIVKMQPPKLEILVKATLNTLTAMLPAAPSPARHNKYGSLSASSRHQCSVSNAEC